ncbi:MAG: hypothetical protein CSB44_10185, partial [Gammaproteobacteria bacterium]
SELAAGVDSCDLASTGERMYAKVIGYVGSSYTIEVTERSSGGGGIEEDAPGNDNDDAPGSSEEFDMLLLALFGFGLVLRHREHAGRRRD